MNEKISIIVAIYNVEQYLTECINSIINQTYTNLEIILVNDGSTDKSGQICDEFLKKDSRIKVIHKKNGGLSDARNTGLDLASGDYIGFVDGDDSIEIDMYEILLKNIKKYNAEISHCGFYKVINSRKYHGLGTDKIIILDNLKGMEEFFKLENYILSVWNKLYKADLIKGIRFENGRCMAEDKMFNFLAFSRAKVTVFEGKEKYLYMQRENSLINSKFNSRVLDVIYFSNKILELTKKQYPQLIQLAEKNDILENILMLTNIEYSDQKEQLFKEYNQIVLKLRNYRYSILKNKELSISIRLALFVIVLSPKIGTYFINKFMSYKK